MNKLPIVIIVILFLVLVYTRVESIDNFKDARNTIESCEKLLDKENCIWVTVYDKTPYGQNNITMQKVCS